MAAKKKAAAPKTAAPKATAKSTPKATAKSTPKASAPAKKVASISNNGAYIDRRNIAAGKYVRELGSTGENISSVSSKKYSVPYIYNAGFGVEHKGFVTPATAIKFTDTGPKKTPKGKRLIGVEEQGQPKEWGGGTRLKFGHITKNVPGSGAKKK